MLHGIESPFIMMKGEIYNESVKVNKPRDCHELYKAKMGDRVKEQQFLVMRNALLVFNKTNKYIENLNNII